MKMKVGLPTVSVIISQRLHQLRTMVSTKENIWFSHVANDLKTLPEIA